MDDKPSQTSNGSRVWIIVAIVLALLFVCVASALVGGMVGYFAGRRAARGETIAPREYRLQPTPEAPVPELPDVPGVPSGWALVVEVTEDSPADRAGLRVGDMITAVDGEPLSADVSLSELVRAHEPGDEVELTVERAGRERTVTVTLGQDPDDGNDAWLGIRYRQVFGPGARFDFEVPGMEDQHFSFSQPGR